MMWAIFPIKAVIRRLILSSLKDDLTRSYSKGGCTVKDVIWTTVINDIVHHDEEYRRPAPGTYEEIFWKDFNTPINIRTSTPVLQLIVRRLERTSTR